MIHIRHNPLVKQFFICYGQCKLLNGNNLLIGIDMREPKPTKICTKCKIEKPRTREFFTFIRGGKYAQSYCKVCDCPSGLTQAMRSAIAAEKRKKYTKVWNSIYKPQRTAKEREEPKKVTAPVTSVTPVIPSTPLQVKCHCCKTLFTPKQKRDNTFCTSECRRTFMDYGRYEQFLGLQDFSAHY